jgi:hypothetical protein
VGVEVVIGAETGEAEALLETTTGEALVDSNAPAVDVKRLLVDTDSVARLLDLGIAAANVLDPEQLLGLERRVDVLAEEDPARNDSLGDLGLALEVGREVDNDLERLLRVVADDVDLGSVHIG